MSIYEGMMLVVLLGVAGLLALIVAMVRGSFDRIVAALAGDGTAVGEARGAARPPRLALA